ncbi:MAG: hypothetical protein RSE02_05990, partial [Bacteroidales bacterium]
MDFLNSKEKKIGFYSTVIFHMLLIIAFLLTTIHGLISEETSFVLDFTKQEELEQVEKIVQMKEQASKEIDDILSGKASDNKYRNVAVDRSSKTLKDDRFKNPNQVYDEANALQKKLDASKREALKEQGADDVVSGNDKVSNNKAETYKGPSVISYSLDGRKSMSLPIPVYKCYGGGDVSIRIVVNKKGYVVDAQVIEGASAGDECIRRYAVDAAKKSRFT